MKTTMKLALLTLLVLCTFLFCVLSASATLLDEVQAISGSPVLEGYCQDADGATNVKWEVYNTGTEDAPDHILYFYIDATSTNTASTLLTSGKSDNSGFVSAGNNDSGAGKTHCWNGNGVDAQTNITRVVVGDDVTGFSSGDVLAGMYGLVTVELPTGFTVMDSRDIKDCKGLKTLYVRGNTPVVGTLDFSEFTKLPGLSTWDYYAFSNLESVEQYKFGADLVTNGWAIQPGCFNNNKSLTSIVLPDGFQVTPNDSTVNNRPVFVNCDSLKSITMSAKTGTINANFVKNCPALEEVIITRTSNTTIHYTEGATTVQEFTAASTANAFNNCPNLKYITAPAGTNVRDLAVSFGMVKPTLVKEGYCINNDGTKTNIKFRIMDNGADFTLYFDIDTSVTIGDEYIDAEGVIMAGSTGGGWIGMGGPATSNQYDSQVWYDAAVPNAKITKAIIGDGITQIGADAGGVVFAGLSGLKTVEIPATLVSMPFGSFKNCSALDTMYIRGNTPEVGTLDFSNFTKLPFHTAWLYDGFHGLRSVKQYKFAESIPTAGSIGGRVFSSNDELTSIVIPEGWGNIPDYMFYNCPKLESITLPSSISWVGGTGGNFYNLPALKLVEFKNSITIKYDTAAVTKADAMNSDAKDADGKTFLNTFVLCPNVEKFIAPIGSNPCAFALKFGIEDIHEEILTDTATCVEVATFNHNTGHLYIRMTLDKAWNERSVGSSWMTFINKVKNDVVHVKLGWYDKICIYGTGKMFADAPKLEKFQFAKNQQIYVGSGRAGSTLFSNSPNLSTVWFGADEDMPEIGTVDFSGFNTGSGGYSSLLYKGLFKGCSSIKNVILKEAFIDSGSVATTIYADTFSGCTSLEKVTIPAGTVSWVITDGAFDTCSALREIQLEDGSFRDSADKIFPDMDGLRVFCKTAEAASSITANQYTYTKAVFFGTVSSRGFAIRLREYNGLRSFFDIDTAKIKELSSAGFDFKEAGAMLISKAKLDTFGQDLKIVASGDTYAPNTSSAASFSIYKGVDENGDPILSGKLLPTDLDGNASTSHFAVTVTNYTANYADDIYAVAYAVYADKATGKEYIEYANYGDQNPSYKFYNLYDITVGMLTTDSTVANEILDEKAVWNTLYQGAAELEGISREIKVGNTVGILSKNNTSGNYILFARNEDGTRPADTSALQSAVTSLNLGYTIEQVLALAVVDTPDFECKTELEAYIDEKLDAANLSDTEKAKSFIFITDTHWNDQWKKDKNPTKLMAYASRQLGGAPVLHGGDLYNGSNDMTATDNGSTVALDNTIGVVNEYITGQLYNTFGSNFLYTLGNHDTNIIGYRNVIEDGTERTYEEKMAIGDKLFIPDKTLYEITVGVYASEKDLVFDESGIAKLKELMIANGYDEATDAYLFESAEYMMKMHYHYDDDDAKIRYIVLDSGGCGYAQTFVLGTGLPSYTYMLSTQYKWFADTLADTAKNKPDYDIVVLGHEIADPKAERDNADTPDVVEYLQFSAGYQKKYCDIITAFKTAGTVTARDSFTGWSSISAIGNAFSNEMGITDYKFDTAYTGTVISLAGHTHVDNAWYVNDGDTSTNTNVQFGSDEAVKTGGTLVISTGSPNEASSTNSGVDGVVYTGKLPNTLRFDIVTLRDDGSVLLTRIGVGVSRSFAYDAK